MLTYLGFFMIITFMFLIMTRKMYALTALILVPIVFGLIGGFGSELGDMMLGGVKQIAPTGVMLIFGIMYFSIMIDVGLFKPLVAMILKLVKGDPLKVTIGTAILTLLVSLDGDGATTYLIVVGAMLPLYKRLNIPRLKLTAIIMCAGGVMNVLPWGAYSKSNDFLEPKFSRIICTCDSVATAGIGMGYFYGTDFWTAGAKEDAFRRCRIQ